MSNDSVEDRLGSLSLVPYFMIGRLGLTFQSGFSRNVPSPSEQKDRRQAEKKRSYPEHTGLRSELTPEPEQRPANIEYQPCGDAYAADGKTEDRAKGEVPSQMKADGEP